MNHATSEPGSASPVHSQAGDGPVREVRLLMPTVARSLRSPQGWLGLLLVAVCWPLNWTLPGMRTAYLFFPLWLGYILTVDGLVLRRSGTSLLHRSPGHFVLLFLASAPSWWLFEIINWRTHNWEYLGGAT